MANKGYVVGGQKKKRLYQAASPLSMRHDAFHPGSARCGDRTAAAAAVARMVTWLSLYACEQVGNNAATHLLYEV